MQLLFFCPLWGSSDLPLETFMEKVRQAGYDGVEVPLPFDDPPRQQQILQAIQNQGLAFIAQHYETAHPDPRLHLAEYANRLENLARAQPMLINTQTGKDWFSFEDNQNLIAAARAISAKAGVKIIHETHRGRFSFNAQATAKYLEANPDLRLAADFSHWCVVSESLLEDQSQALALAITRSDHIHARVGFPEGPQVSDPRAPEWKPALEAHLGWWDRIIAFHRASGTPVMTLTPEFGPAPYMPTLPFTGMPLTSQWDVNLYMLNLLRERYRSL
jgi:sugar phosphate isomerase/epimerase